MDGLWRHFNQSDSNFSFDEIKISIMDPAKIRELSYGEVKKPDTVNYRTIKPEPGGLFCSRIFGPTKDYECLCGKYKRMKYRGIVCEKCGVEVTTAKVRRERMGHIDLAVPVVHIWFMRSLPCRIGMLLDIPLKELEKVLYFERYIVVEPGTSPFTKGELLTDEEFDLANAEFSEEGFVAKNGAEAIKAMLDSIDLNEAQKSLRAEMKETTSETKRKKIVKRLKLVENLLQSGNNPSWMVMEVLPIMPPDLRPLVTLDAGRFATSDLNELYRRVINRNIRLKRLMELKAPEIIIRNEKRMLQESVDALFDNGKKSRVVRTASKRPLKSISDMLKGKQGRFRQNLLGKRVDYSGRSVIVVGPELKLHQCGIPKKMALELFKPFIYSKLESYGMAATLRAAKKMVEQERSEVWDILDGVIKQHPILLNRAPTLHRLGIQAFEPVLVEGKAIQLHPLVCYAFNADFDGDQMAVHVPLSVEAQLEARVLMMSTNNILSPANGEPVVVPTQDMVLGVYYLTLALDNDKGEGSVFSGIAEVEHALNAGHVALHAKIKCRRMVLDHNGNRSYILTDTTPGRIILSELLPEDGKVKYDLINRTLKVAEISQLVKAFYKEYGQKETVIFVDRLMQLGFYYATKGAISFSKDDMVIPEGKASHISNTMAEIKQYEAQYADGLITSGEKYNKVIDAWTGCTDKVAHDMIMGISSLAEGGPNSLAQEKLNSIFMMADSGARGSTTQMKQMAGMKGLISNPSGKIIETPITSNFREGLTALEYFISTSGARKGSADTALKTANSGYLTRRLVDVSQDCIVIEHDCGTTDGIIIKPTVEAGDIIVPLAEKIIGRTAANDIHHPGTGAKVLSAGELIDPQAIEGIEEAGIDTVKVRSVLLCKSKGVKCCTKCYGSDMSTGLPVNVGEAVGIIAAQSIGEPGTQLTMNTFHIGGAVQKSATQSDVISSVEGKLAILHKNIIKNSQGQNILMSRNCELVILDDQNIEKVRYKVPYGAVLLAEDGERVKIGTKLAQWDPFTVPIIVEKSGVIEFKDMVDGISVKEDFDESTGVSNVVVTDWKHRNHGGDFRPRILLNNSKGERVILSSGLEARYFLPVGSVLNVHDGDKVAAGDVIAKLPKDSSKTKDITGGLLRVTELFEAMISKNHSLISESEGMVEFGRDYKSKRRIIVKPNDPSKKAVEYFVPRGRHIVVNEGDYVNKGDLLMEGNPSPQDILRIMGLEALREHMVEGVQQIYRFQGVTLHDKHIDVVLHKMLQKVEITDPGDTTFLLGEQVDKEDFAELNKTTIEMGGRRATAMPVIQGITKAALQTRSFLSAASFQETTRVLTEAVLSGKVDTLQGLKENVLVGRLIPAGTGLITAKIEAEARLRDDEILAARKDAESKEVQEVVGDVSIKEAESASSPPA